MFFDREYVFKGKHAKYVIELKNAIFARNIDVLIIAPIVGFLYGRTAKRDEESPSTDNVKKINF